MTIYFTISVSVYLRPSEGLRLTRINVLPPVAPGGGLQRSKKWNSRRFDLAGQSLLRELDWAGAESSHRRTRGRAPFRIQLHRLSGTVHQSETPRARRFGAVSNETLRGVHRPEQIPKPPGGSETRKGAATSVRDTLRKTRKDFKPLAVGTPCASLHFSMLHATTSWTPSGIAPRSISARRSDEKPVRGPAVFWWEWYGTCISTYGFAARSWELDSETPVAACDVCFKK